VTVAAPAALVLASVHVLAGRLRVLRRTPRSIWPPAGGGPLVGIGLARSAPRALGGAPARARTRGRAAPSPAPAEPRRAARLPARARRRAPRAFVDDDVFLYRVAWIGGVVMYDTAALRTAGGFGFWREPPAMHCGEDVLAQLRVMARSGGCGMLPSGAYHLELPTTIGDRRVDTPCVLPPAVDVAPA
jgi:hypothetical protein